jgi:hypothetical protein
VTGTGGRSAFLLLTIALLAVTAGRERHALQQIRDFALELQTEAALAEDYKRALVAVVNDREAGSGPLLVSERSVGSSEARVVIDDASDLVLYRFATACPFSHLNYEILNELHRSGVPVFGVAVDTAEDDVRAIADQGIIEFPVLFHPQGRAMTRMPRYGTPTTVWIRGEKVVLLEFGQLNPAAEIRLRARSNG